jgi:hypothetical protein
VGRGLPRPPVGPRSPVGAPPAGGSTGEAVTGALGGLVGKLLDRFDRGAR